MNSVMKKERTIVRDKLVQELVNNIPDVIYFKDKKGRLLLVNKAHAGGLGLTPEKVVGKTDFDFFPAEQAERMTQDDRRVMQTGLPLLDRLEKTTQPDGSRHYVSTTKIPRKDKKGRVIGIMGITRDITERKRIERQQAAERQKAARELHRLKNKLEFEKKKLEQVINIEEGLNAIIKLDKLVEFVVDRTVHLLEARKCSLMIMDEKTQELSIKGHRGLDERFVQGSKLKIGDNSIAGLVAGSEKPLLVIDIEKDKRLTRKNRVSYKSKSFLSVPMKVDHQFIGVINVADKESDESDVFSLSDLKVLDTIASQVAIAIENTRLYKELKYLTITDPLTDMYNYRHLAKTLDYEIKRMKRYVQGFCLLMIDVDDFKSYNDVFGHLAGDHLLKEVSRVLNKNIRNVDIACRYAGDEFAIILPQTQLAGARIVAGKIKRSIEDIALQAKITLSIGVANYQKGMDRNDLILRADSALYEAKKKGKNRVCVMGNNKIVKNKA